MTLRTSRLLHNSLRRLMCTVCSIAAYCFLLASVHAAGDQVLELAMVESRLSTLQEQETPADSEILKSYQESRDFLIQAEVYLREKQQYIESLRTAPEREAQIQRQIDEYETTPLVIKGLEVLDRSELRARLLTVRTEQEEAESDLAALDRRLAARESKAAESRAQLATIKGQLDSLPDDIGIGSGSDQPSAGEAVAWRAVAEQVALKAERQAIEARLSSQPLRYSMLAVQRTELNLLNERLVASVKALEAELDARMLEASDAVDMGFEPSTSAYSAAQLLVATDTTLREERIEVGGLLARVRASADQKEAQSVTLQERYAIARRMVEFAGESDTLGQALLAHWQELEDLQKHADDVDISKEIASTVIRRIQHEGALKKLSSISSYIDELLVASGTTADAIRERDYAALQELAQNYRTRLHSIIDTQSEYLDSLNGLKEIDLVLKSLSKEYRDYLTSLILWIPDYRPLWQSDAEYSLPIEIGSAREDLKSVRMANIGWMLAALLVALFLVRQKPQLKAWQESLNAQIAKPRDDSILHTFWALAGTVLLALPGPILLAGIALMLAEDTAVAYCVTAASFALLLLSMTRELCASTGVGVVHFGWNRQITDKVHADTRWLIYFWLPTIAFIAWLVLVTPWESHAIIMRSAIVLILMPPLCLLIASIYKKSRDEREALPLNAMQRSYLLFACLLMLAALAMVLGHVYSVTVIARCLTITIWTVFGLLLLHSLLMRWIFVTRRRLRMLELLESYAGNDAPEESITEEQIASLGDVSEDSRELVNVALVATGLAALIAIWAPLLPAMSKLSDITLWTSSSMVDGTPIENEISLATVLIILILTGLTVYAARKMPAMIDLLLRSHAEVSASARYTVSALLNYTIIGGGAVAAFSAMGVQWSQLQWLVAALGVGIGFGLQEIIANFISGLIILFERPIRVGDVVSTGESDGVVAKIRIRATTIVDWDGKELLVPNKEFITGRLLNWSLNDTKIRLVLPVGIAYGSDVEGALKILHEVVASHPRVLDDPEPSIIFDAFGDNALSLVARCFLNSMENRLGVMTELNKEIYRRFEEDGIVIAFPQRDVHLDFEKPLHITLDGGVPDPG